MMKKRLKKSCLSCENYSCQIITDILDGVTVPFDEAIIMAEGCEQFVPREVEQKEERLRT